jgi:hypothetical protein
MIDQGEHQLKTGSGRFTKSTFRVSIVSNPVITNEREKNQIVTAYGVDISPSVVTIFYSMWFLS